MLCVLNNEEVEVVFKFNSSPGGWAVCDTGDAGLFRGAVVVLWLSMFYT